jgi:5-methylcytosine-specific restriction endonuclease McrA
MGRESPPAAFQAGSQMLKFTCPHHMRTRPVLQAKIGPLENVDFGDEFGYSAAALPPVGEGRQDATWLCAVLVGNARFGNSPAEETPMNHCVVLNADYTFLNLVNWKRAMSLLAKGKVEIIKASRHTVRCSSGRELKIPSVIRLIKLIRTIYRTGVAFTKRNVMVRDRFRCGYCGARCGILSIDHIIPKSRGGKTTFENCVTACKACNLKKGSRTPGEARMFLKSRPYQPTISEFLRLKFESLGVHEVLMDLGIF